MHNSINQRLAEGDAGAFAELYDCVADSVYHFLLVQSGSADDAAEVLQETFLRLYRSRHRLDGVENLKAYTFQVARNQLRTRMAAPRVVQLDPALAFELTAPASSHLVEDAEWVVNALSHLPERYREIIEMKIYGQFNFQEIAGIVNRPVGTVATWYRRGIEQMRNLTR